MPGFFICTNLMNLKNAEDIEGITHVSEVVAKILKTLCSFAKAGMSTLATDKMAGELFLEFKAIRRQKNRISFRATRV